MTEKVDNPTSRDIANIAGVSQATVSRALRNSPLVREETRERIQKIARDLNYLVNRDAARLRTRQSKTIALLLFEEAGGKAQINPFFLSMLGYITRSAAARGYNVLVSLQQPSDDWHTEFRSSHRADGLILLGFGDYEAYRNKLRVLAEANTRFIIWGPAIADYPGRSFGCDNDIGGHQATHHLIELGRKRIACIGGASERVNPEYAERHDGYRRALVEAGLPVDDDLWIETDNSEASGSRAIEQLIASGVAFDAVFAVTDLLAIGAMRTLTDRGLRVPEDVSVVGFDDIPLARYVTPALTTVEQDRRKAGKALVQGIIRLIEGQRTELGRMTPKLVVRGSCGSSPT